MNQSQSAEELELQRKKKVTCNYKYKYLSQLKLNKLESYDPTYDLYAEYLKDKDNNGIRMYIRPDEDSDYYIVPGVNIVAGQTGHGKSMVANNIAYHAVKDGKNVMFITLEISKKKVFYQMLSIHSRTIYDKESDWISHSDIKKHKLNGNQESHVFNDLWKDFNQLKGNLYVIEETDFDSNSIDSLQEIMFLVEEYAQTHTGHGLDLVVIDYVQLFKQYADIRNEYEALSKWANDLRRISRNFLGQNHEITMLLLSQLNRDAMADVTDREKKKAKNSVLPSDKKKNLPDITIGLNQIAGSVELCKHADTVYAIYSDDSYRASEQAMMFILKNRDGAASSDGVTVHMNPKYYCFGSPDEWSTEYQGDIATVLDFENLPPSVL